MQCVVCFPKVEMTGNPQLLNVRGKNLTVKCQKNVVAAVLVAAFCVCFALLFY